MYYGKVCCDFVTLHFCDHKSTQYSSLSLLLRELEPLFIKKTLHENINLQALFVLHSIKKKLQQNVFTTTCTGRESFCQNRQGVELYKAKKIGKCQNGMKIDVK